MRYISQHIDTLYDLHIITPRAIVHKDFPMIPPYPVAAIAHILSILENRVHTMANKSKGNVAAWNKITFINRNLTEPEKKDFLTYYKTEGERLADHLGQVMVDDYKISCTWDDNNQCFIATFTGKEDQRFNSNVALSSRSDDWYEALGINLFKHLVIFKGGLWSGENNKNNWG